jgi:spermidine synthase
MALLYVCTLFVSAALLMMIQPLSARMVLPYLGGTPGVWNTCMLFFQTGLLAGYLYAYGLARWLPGGRAVFVHVTLLLLSWWMLPIDLPRPEAAPAAPLVWLLTALLLAIALPYIILASMAPLLQRWFASASFGDPYFLYAASNAGSFAGLLAYPFLIEPQWTLHQQAELWRWGYAGLIALTLACGAARLRSRSSAEPPVSMPSPTVSWSQRLRWLLLALVPSSLLLSVTSYLTTDIAAIPLFWVVPLALYLLTFTLVFAARPIVRWAMLTRWQPLVIVVLMLLWLREANEPLAVVLVLHAELARTRPAPARLTEFYFWLALGGALGGAFNTLLAPLVFSGYAEYPLMIALAAALRSGEEAQPASFWDWVAPALLGAFTALVMALNRWLRWEASLSVFLVYLVPLVACYTLQGRPLRFALAVAAIFLASLLDPGVHGPSAYRVRSFFGVHRVTEQEGLRRLVHGNTVHGQQFVEPAKRREPLTYYHRTGPMGQMLATLEGDARRGRIGLVGLGAGSLAAYAQAGDRWTFFEIDPAVVHIARDGGLFTFLSDSRGDIDIVLGDARLTLSQTADRFRLLVIDAFGSDAIPWHLLTREAVELYRSRLQERGILAFHISNRYVDLEPVLANQAREMGWYCGVIEDLSGKEIERHPGKSASKWLFLAERREHLPGPALGLRPGRADPHLRPWTDDYANLLPVIHWRGVRE